MEKKYALCSLLLAMLLYFSVPAQTPNHPTVEKIKVGYKPVPGSALTNTTAGKPDIKVFPDVSITLKNTGTVSKVYLKILNKTDNSTIYQINYSLSSQAVTDAQGLKLFYRDNAIVHIGDPNAMSLDTYKYQVITEDAQGHQSVEYTAIQ
ncbi:MAG: hypothetical protein ACXVPQ_11015 [Bacteroidia bacterium]